MLVAASAYGQTALSIGNASLQMSEDGPSVEAGRLFRPGELAYGSFTISNFKQNPGADISKDDPLISLSYRVEVFDPLGIAIQPSKEGKVAVEMRREDKDWRPKVRFELIVPPLPPSGTYRVEAWVKDEFANKEATHTIPFEVKGYDVATSDKLTVSNVRFQRTDRTSEDGMPSPVYHAGEFVWALFDVSGFKLGPKNRYDVEYGLAVLDGTGKVLFEQDPAAQLNEEPDYPKRALPGALSVQIAAGTPKTKYQLRLRVKDRVGDQTTEHVGDFSVE